MISFFVAGTPMTQGSKRAFVVNGRPVLTEAGGDRHRLWRHAVNDAARQAFAGREPLTGPVALDVRIRLVRPASHPKRRVTWPIGARSGDADKFLRSVCDALAGVAFVNDAQVVDARVTKTWATDGPGVLVTVSEKA